MFFLQKLPTKMMNATKYVFTLNIFFIFKAVQENKIFTKVTEFTAVSYKLFVTTCCLNLEGVINKIYIHVHSE